MNALVYVEHRPGHSLGKKSDEDLKCSPQSWLDDFMQLFSWRSPLVRALDFLNKLFLSGVFCITNIEVIIVVTNLKLIFFYNMYSESSPFRESLHFSCLTV